MQKYEPVDFLDLVCTVATVFGGLAVSRDRVERFLRTNNTDGLIRPDRELLLDLRVAVEHLIQRAPARIDAEYVASVNQRFGRTGGRRPGDLRRGGPGGPPALNHAGLEGLVERAFAQRDPMDVAVALASHLTRDQPFEGANRRTAWFVAAGVLLPFGLTMPVPTSPGFIDALEHGLTTGDMSSAEATMRSSIVCLIAPVVRRQRPERYVVPDRPRRPSYETDDLLRAMGGDPASPPMYRATQVANAIMDRAFDQHVKVSGTQLIAAVLLVEAQYLRTTGGRPLIEGTDTLDSIRGAEVITHWIKDTDGTAYMANEARDSDLRAALDFVWAAIRR